MVWVKAFALVMLLCSSAYAEVTSSEIRVALNKAYNYSYFNHEVDPIVRAIDYLINENNITLRDKERIADAVYRASYSTGVDWRVILSVVFVESRFVNTIGDKRQKGSGYWSYGHMQVHFKWWGEAIVGAGLSELDMLNPYKGIVVGSLILRQRIERHGLKTGIRYYNGRSQDSYIYMTKVLSVYESIK